jgi:glycosyltransferase involved in cell wall biosynthesis
VVCIPVYGGHEHFAACLRSVLERTPTEVPILICDDASPDPRSRELVADLDPRAHNLVYMRQDRNVGFPANVNAAFAAASPADVVVLNSDCEVAEGWIEGLREAAYVDSTVATATALSNHGSLVSVPDRRPSPQLHPGWDLDRAAAAIRERSLRIRPRLPTAIGHCMLVRRTALDLVGDFDLAFTPGYGEEVDFSQRCLRSGLSHVLADDVLVFHHGGGSFSSNGQPSPSQEEHERLLARRYPYYHDGVGVLQDDVAGPLARALGVARRALKGLSVAIDARVLVGPITGTHLHVVELTAALARSGEARIAVIVPEELNSWAGEALRTLSGVRLLTRHQAEAVLTREPADVVHRPFQIANDEDLAFLAQLGERLIITNQDLIGYRNPSYFRDGDAWQGYRRITRNALSLADRVLFFSAHARDDALAEDLVEPSRASVVYIGVDHRFAGEAATLTPARPERAELLPADAEAILCIGTDFRHKNRVFALRMLEELQRRHAWKGYLLLAGPTVAQGSSRRDEAAALRARPEVDRATLDLGAVSEAEKEWLYARAQLVLYPTVYEGFGLVPFEAAAREKPCLWARGTSLSELLPDEAAQIVPWDAEASADRANRLLHDQALRRANVAAVREVARNLSWEATAARLLECYSETCDAPASSASAIERRDGSMSGMLSEDAMRLIGPGGALPADLERPLLALATHRQIAGPMFRAMKLGYRASYRLRHRGGKG